MSSSLCPMLSALCLLPHALRPMRFAPCSLPYALRAPPYAPCPLPYALCAMLSALCALRFTLCPEAISFFGQALHQRIKWPGKCDDTVVLELLGDGAQIDAKRF